VEYRRSVALGLRFTMRMLAALYLLGIAAALLGIGPAWLRHRHVLSDMSHGIAVLELLLGLIERRVNPDPPVAGGWRPSAALSGTAVVALTGLAAALATGWGAQGLSGLIMPIAMLISTAILTTFVYRFAKRHAGQIGEARFETMKP